MRTTITDDGDFLGLLFPARGNTTFYWRRRLRLGGD